MVIGFELGRRDVTERPHQPLDGAARHGDAFAVELAPDLLGAVDLMVGRKRPGKSC